MFKIYIDNTASFSITMTGTSLSADNDTKLYVMDAIGNLLFSDDDSGSGLLSQLNPGALASNPAGLYLVAYNLFSSSPIGTNPVTGWNVSPSPAQTGIVQLNFTNAQFANFVPTSVPEPGSLALAAIGLAGLGFANRRTKA